jgi:putative tryptophan/tyrosine transport system substrate-binding protein
VPAYAQEAEIRLPEWQAEAAATERPGGKLLASDGASHPENGGLIVTASPGAVVHRELIIMLAARHRLPAVYPFRYFVTSGGLISYGPDTTDQFRRAAGYVDRILKGEKATDLPVQAPTKYELAIDLKTANALGLTVPQSLIALADGVVE